MNTEFYIPTEIAEKLRVNVMTIYRYIKDGKIAAHKLGKELRIDVKEYERFLKSIETKN
jgi:excisionase family DNA binding protein